MKRWLLLAAILACSVGTAFAQGVPATANLTAQDSGACTTPNACLQINIPKDYASALVQLSGTFSATVQFEASTTQNGAFTAIAGIPVGAPAASAVSSSTAPGAWRFNISSVYYLRVRVSAYTSGTVTAALTASPASSYSGSGTGVAAGVSSFSGDGSFSCNSGSSGLVAFALCTDPVLPNGSVATTQAPGDNTTQVATDAFVLANTSAGNPAAPPAGVQLANAGATAFGTATGLNSILFGLDSYTSPTVFNIPWSTCTAGPNPGIGSCAYHMRALTSYFTATASVNANTTISFTAGNYANFQNFDGMMIPGAGSANLLSTPTGLTVTPCLISGVDWMQDCIALPFNGSTSSSYCANARTKTAGYSPCSSTVTTTTGFPLGNIQKSITGMGRIGEIVTVTMASPINCVVGAAFANENSSDASFSGLNLISSCGSTSGPSSTLTFIQGNSSLFPVFANDNATLSTNAATGGTGIVYSGNKIALPAVSGTTYQYGIYTAGSSFLGWTRPSEASYIDFGQAAQTLNPWYPATAPATGQANALITTIVSGAPTATVTVANAASQVATGLTAYFDDGVNLQNACNAAASISGTGSGMLEISTAGPGKYYWNNSHVSCNTGPLTVMQRNTMVLNEAIEFVGQWYGTEGGQNGTNTSFGWGYFPLISVSGAYPGMILNGANVLRSLTFTAPAQGLAMTLEGGFNSTLHYVNCQIGAGDITGGCFVGYGAASTHFDHISFSTNDSSGYYYGFASTLLMRDNVSGSAGFGNTTLNFPVFVGRGAGFETNPFVGSGAIVRVSNEYGQALDSPAIIMGPSNNPTLFFDTGRNDSSPVGLAANFGTSLTVHLENLPDNSTEAGGRPGTITGNPTTGTAVNMGNAPSNSAFTPTIGQNVGLNNSGPGCFAVNQSCAANNSYVFGVNGNTSLSQLNSRTYYTHTQPGADWCTRAKVALSAAGNTNAVINSLGEVGTQTCLTNWGMNLTGNAGIEMFLPAYPITMNSSTSAWVINANDVRIHGTGATGATTRLNAGGSFPASTPLVTLGASGNQSDDLSIDHVSFNCTSGPSTCTDLTMYNIQERGGAWFDNFLGANSASATGPCVLITDPNGGGHWNFEHNSVGACGDNDGVEILQQATTGGHLDMLTCNNTGKVTGAGCVHHVSISSSNTISFDDHVHAEGFLYTCWFGAHTGGSCDHADSTGTNTDVLLIDAGALAVTAAGPIYGSGTNQIVDNSTSPAFTATVAAFPNGYPSYPPPPGLRAGLNTTVVGSLPSASGNPGAMYTVSDSTTISAEGQTCVGSSSTTALAVSNGTIWKCF